MNFENNSPLILNNQRVAPFSVLGGARVRNEAWLGIEMNWLWMVASSAFTNFLLKMMPWRKEVLRTYLRIKHEMVIQQKRMPIRVLQNNENCEIFRWRCKYVR